MSLVAESNDSETRRESLVALDPGPRSYIDNLAPPPNFVYWKRQESHIFSDLRLHDPSDRSVYASVNWKCVFYVYATGARPTEPGVIFYIVMVHSGDVSQRFSLNRGDFGLRIRPDSSTTEAQLPEYSTQNGSDWHAEIDYKKTMQMFTDSGNRTEPFNAEYVRKYRLKDIDQSGAITNNVAEIRFRPKVRWAPGYGIHGLTIFRTTNLSKFPLHFITEAWATFGDNPEVKAGTFLTVPFEH